MNILLRNNVEEKNILFFCDNNSRLWGEEIKRNVNNREIKKIVISIDELKKYCSHHKRVIIIIATLVEKFYLKILNQVKEIGITNIIISSEEILKLRDAFLDMENKDKKIYKKSFIEERRAAI